jgi:hypothetical protein
VVKNGSKDGQQRWVCRNCKRSFGPTLGTAMYRLRNTLTEVAHTLLVVMRRGSLSAAEEITGHKYETIGRWLRAAARQAEQITNALVHDLHLTAVEVDAFWSFVKKVWSTCRPSQRVGRDGPALGMRKWDRPRRFGVAWAFAASEDEAAPRVVAQTRQRTAGQRGVP